MSKFFYNNTLLKVLSFAIAIVLWGYIIVIIDAPTERTLRDIPINTVNEHVLSDNGYSIEKLSIQLASVKIEGSRRVIAKFDSDNVVAKLDFSEVNAIKMLSEGVVTVNLRVTSEFGEVVSFTPSAVDVYVEPTKYKDIEVRQTHSGEVLEGYKTGDFKLSQNRVRIFGAQSNIDEVEYAAINIDMINTKFEAYNQGEISQECDVVLYKNDGKEISAKNLRWIWNDSSKIILTCPLYKTKIINIVPDFDDTLSGIHLECNPSSITVYGNNERIADLNEIKTSPMSKNSFENVSSINVKLILPTWVKVVDNIEEVNVSANTN